MNEIFSHYIKTDNIIFKHARGSSTESGKEFHTFHEIILFCDGEGEFITESEHILLRTEALIVIPKESYHQLIIDHDPNNYHRSVLQFYDDKELSKLITRKLQNTAIIIPNEEIKYIFNRVNKAAKEGLENPDLFLKSLLTLLLIELPDHKRNEENEYSHNLLIRKIIKFINDHIAEDLSLKTISIRFNRSPSSVSHLFRQEMNISLHQFIIKKRLICSYQLILSGTPPTAAAVESGFRDYSGFYKQYKKMFGFPPSYKNPIE